VVSAPALVAMVTIIYSYIMLHFIYYVFYIKKGVSLHVITSHRRCCVFTYL